MALKDPDDGGNHSKETESSRRMEGLNLFELDIEEISFADSIELEGYSHNAHCFIYAFSSHKVMGKHPAIAAVMMQMRFDGKIGFPGGMVDEGVDIIKGVNRELEEEINLNTSIFPVLQEHHIISDVNHSYRTCYHFYGLKVTLDEFESIEKGVFEAKEYGNETLGLLRVPLYTYEQKDGFKGLPAFLQNNFIGNAKEQLLHALTYFKIMPVNSALTALQRSREMKQSW